ncbi:uncharacterized protein LOC121245803 isoform X2 [Juglans microcarpa x Juglans regia]|uniref:uncharacterized protein LOC121245803 isoform X2 n=1 Tax=Juglans microcarpa x Juglans regia TaxID=2249226 RepID=UPI001B7DD356|nr:uncharacterized protein LOC121245803 isoform X2 [Juglans microcarpa x Juglans regia]
MGKRSQRLPLRYRKDQSGCMWGLISIFDFRQGRSTQRLLSDKSRGSRHVTDTGYSSNKFEVLTILDGNNQGTLDGKESTTAVGKPSVKKLMEEEMFSEQDLKKKNSNAEVEPKPSKLGHESNIKTKHKRTKKTRKKSCDMDNHDLDASKNLESECSCNEYVGKQSIENNRIDDIMEEFCRWIHQKSLSSMEHDQDDEVQMPSNQKQFDFDGLREEIKDLINQKSVNVKHHKENGKTHHAKGVVGGLEVLSSDEELFQKLMQDPNSLMAKYVLNLKDTQIEKGKEPKSVPESNLSDLELGGLRQAKDGVNHKQQRNFFGRKVKSQKRSLSKQNGNSEASNRIVILKPGPAGFQNSKTEFGVGSSPEPHCIVGDKGSTERVGALFFLAEIKRKLKSAMGKEWSGISTISVSNNFPHDLRDSNTEIDKENTGKSSPSIDHFYTERIGGPAVGINKGGETGKLKDPEISMEHETDGHPKQRVSNIYVEAKKHLSELLSNEDEGVDFSSKQVHRTLGRILSLPEYNLTPIGSPGRNWEDKFVTSQMRISASAKLQEVNSNTWSPKRENIVSHLDQATQNLESQSSISDSPVNRVLALSSKPSPSEDHFYGNGEEGAFVSISDEMSPEGAVVIGKSTDVVVQGEISVMYALPDSSSSLDTRDDRNAETSEICDDTEYCESLKQESYEKKQVSSPPLVSPYNSVINQKAENLESAVDIPERPSPVSVLEPLFTEDDISPTKSTSPSVKLPLQQIQFEEHNSSTASQVNCAKSCMDDKEVIFEYVKAVLQASGLNWDEFCVKCLASDQLLDPSLFDEVECFPNHLGYNWRLLFDCTNEVLLEVCQRHFGCCPWVSFIKPSIRPVPNMKNIIHEVCEGVHWHFLPLPLPHTLDQIVRKDMGRMGTWMDLHFDVDTIGVEMGEAILEDLMEDIILGCENENQASEYTSVLTELENGNSISL